MEIVAEYKGKITPDEFKATQDKIRKIAAFNKCEDCDEEFDQKNEHHLDSWKIIGYGTNLILLCPSCQ